MSVPPSLPPTSHQTAPVAPRTPQTPPKPGLSGCAIAAIILSVVGVIGIAVVGMLAAIAIPQYQDYVLRTQVTSVVRAASDLQFAIDEHQAQYETCPDADTFAALADAPAQAGSGENTLTGRWEWREPDQAGQCAFTLIFGKPGHLIDGTTLEFRSEAENGWTCGDGTLPTPYRRLSCAGTVPSMVE